MRKMRRGGREISLVRVLGFPITIDPSWFVIFFLVTWTLAKGFFPFRYPSLPPEMYWAMGAIGAVLLFASILLHELSHAYVARLFGLKVERITLFIFGGVSQLVKEPANAVTEFWMAIAGPIMSYLLAFLFWVGGQSLLRMEAWVPIPAVILYAALINVILGTFNLIPGFPLDGGRVLRASLWYFMGSLRRATRIASRFGTGFAFLLMAWGMMLLLAGNLIGGLWSMLIGFFLWRASEMGYTQVLLRRQLEGVTVGEVMRPQVVSLSPGLTLQEAVDRFFLHHSFHSFPVTAQDRMIGLISMDRIRQVPRSEWSRRTVGEVMEGDPDRIAVRASDPLLTVLERMQQEDRGRYPVTDGNGDLEGIISRRDIMYQLHLRLDLEK